MNSLNTIFCSVLKPAAPARRSSILLTGLLVTIAAMLLTALPGFATPVTRNVPGTYATIQDAIDVSSSGDTIMVAPGTYTNKAGFYNLTVVNTSTGNPVNVTITSSGGPSNTILDLTGSAQNEYVVEYNSPSFIAPPTGTSTTPGSTFSGFTIRNDASESGPIVIENCSPTIENCIFKNNSSTGFGGAINTICNLDAMSPTISQCEFFSNTAGNVASGTYGFGGAIEAQDYQSNTLADTVTIVNCLFSGNEAAYDGGAIDAADEKTTDSSAPLRPALQSAPYAHSDRAAHKSHEQHVACGY